MSQNVYRARRGSSAGRSRFNNSRPRNNNSRRGPAKQNIHPSRFIKVAKITEIADYVPENSFADFDVHPTLTRNIAEKGFTSPSPIQDQAIPHALKGLDVVGLANTGTGKTAAFVIPITHKLLHNRNSRAIIVAPTRELAQQIEAEARTFIKGSNVYTAILTGGSPMYPQVRDLRRDPQIVIGTPGRIKDHIERGNLKLAGFETVVLDEVDRMLDMGFVNEITALLKQLHADRQSLFFSATIDPKIESLIRTFSKDPVTVSVRTGNTGENIDQDVIALTPSENKMEKLHDVLNSEKVVKTLVFDETKRSVDRLSRELASRGFSVDSIHGDKTQGQRKRALDRFRRSEVDILVATDVAARGIDIVDITHVINYTTPQSYEDYVHRIGRAGRAGRVGYALTFVN